MKLHSALVSVRSIKHEETNVSIHFLYGEMFAII